MGGVWIAENADVESSVNESTIDEGPEDSPEMEAEQEAVVPNSADEGKEEDDPNSSMQVEPPSMISDSVLEESVADQASDSMKEAEPEESAPVAEPEIVPEV